MPNSPALHRPSLTRGSAPKENDHRQDRRGTSASRGYGHKWRKQREKFLQAHNHECCQCGEPANVVDHRIPHKGNLDLFWDQDNWQCLCKRCHDIKTGQGK